MKIEDLLKEYGGLYSLELGIDVEKHPFKWFLASMLFGGRISTTVAKSTYREYEKAGLVTPQRIAESTRDQLIRVHGSGGYVRYDGITADYVQGAAKVLLQKYGADLTQLDRVSKSPEDLESRLQEFRGVGPVTAKIFLRELRGIWRNADPEPTNVEILAAKKLGILASKKNALRKLKKFWDRNAVTGYDFRAFEAALVRFGLQIRRRRPVDREGL